MLLLAAMRVARLTSEPAAWLRTYAPRHAPTSVDGPVDCRVKTAVNQQRPLLQSRRACAHRVQRHALFAGAHRNADNQQAAQTHTYRRRVFSVGLDDKRVWRLLHGAVDRLCLEVRCMSQTAQSKLHACRSLTVFEQHGGRSPNSAPSLAIPLRFSRAQSFA